MKEVKTIAAVNINTKKRKDQKAKTKGPLWMCSVLEQLFFLLRSEAQKIEG